jgi:type I restriction enzyme, R subunit
LVGLTATPDARTYGFFQKNVVSEYTHEKAVADGVNVGNEVYLIETQVTAAGRQGRRPNRWWKNANARPAKALGSAGRRNLRRQTARPLCHGQPDQIRTMIRTFRDKLPEIFPGRTEVPKTLIFAKTDSHADDIIQIVRQEFGERQRVLPQDHQQPKRSRKTPSPSWQRSSATNTTPALPSPWT